jgi:hypothetical protein
VAVLFVLPVSAAPAATREQGCRQCDGTQAQAAVEKSFHRNVPFFHDGITAVGETSLTVTPRVFAAFTVNRFRPTAVNALVDSQRRLVTLAGECETCPR